MLFFILFLLFSLYLLSCNHRITPEDKFSEDLGSKSVSSQSNLFLHIIIQNLQYKYTLTIIPVLSSLLLNKQPPPNKGLPPTPVKASRSLFQLGANENPKAFRKSLPPSKSLPDTPPDKGSSSSSSSSSSPPPTRPSFATSASFCAGSSPSLFGGSEPRGLAPDQKRRSRKLESLPEDLSSSPSSSPSSSSSSFEGWVSGKTVGK